MKPVRFWIVIILLLSSIILSFAFPKAKYAGAGFTVKELKDAEFHTLNSTFKAHTLYTEKGGQGFLSFYWIIIDKKIAHEWIEQKIKQLYFSLFNKKRVGLMVRIDIPVKKDNIKDAIILAKQFVNDLSEALPPEEADYI